MPRLRATDLDDVEDLGGLDDHDDHASGRGRRPGAGRGRVAEPDEWEPAAIAVRRRTPDGSEEFKCGHCRAFIGPTISGGRHRNHCPLCLYSRHVDGKTPGDRASACRALMAPVGIFARPNGEEVVLHRCGGCGLERYNRIAADDNPLVLEQLPMIELAPSLLTPQS